MNLRRAWFDAADYRVDRHLREGHGGHTAVIAPARTLSYRQLADEVHTPPGWRARVCAGGSRK